MQEGGVTAVSNHHRHSDPGKDSAVSQSKYVDIVTSQLVQVAPESRSRPQMPWVPPPISRLVQVKPITTRKDPPKPEFHVINGPNFKKVLYLIGDLNPVQMPT